MKKNVIIKKIKVSLIFFLPFCLFIFSGCSSLNDVFNPSITETTVSSELNDTTSLGLTISGPFSSPSSTSSNISILENTRTIYTVTANETVTWSISGIDAELVTINNVSGQLTFVNNIDYEQPVDDNLDNILDIFITAENSQGVIATQQLFIGITKLDRSDNNITIK